MKRVEAPSRTDLSTYTEKHDIQDNHTSNVLTVDSLVAMTVVVMTVTDLPDTLHSMWRCAAITQVTF